MPSYKMNSRWLESLKSPDSGQVDYFDSKISGLVLRVGKKGKNMGFDLPYAGKPAQEKIYVGAIPLHDPCRSP